MLMEYKLKELGEILTGNTPSKNNSEFYNSKDIMFIKPDDIGLDITEVDNTKEYISQGAITKARIVPKNSLLVTCIGTIGKVAINKEKSSFNQQINGIIPNDRIYSSKYLAYAIIKNKKQLQSIANAPVVPIINKSQFSEFVIKIHGIEEQKKVVEVLDKSQELIDKRKAQIEALDELVKSRFIEMFGDPIKPQNSIKLGEIALLERGRFSPRPRNDPKYYGGKHPFIQTGDISNSNHRLNQYKQTLNEEGIRVSKCFSSGTIVIAIVGATIGATAILERDVYAPDSIIGITPFENECNNIFLEMVLQFWRPELLRMAPESARANINLGILQNIPMVKVKLDQQNQFADFVKQVDKLKFEMKKSLKELENNFNALMQRAFKGELFN